MKIYEKLDPNHSRMLDECLCLNNSHLMEHPLKKTSITVLLLVLISSSAVSQRKTSFGINAGIGEWRMLSLEESYRVVNTLPQSYPIGYTLGIFIEYSRSEQFSVVPELFYQK